MQKTSIAPEDRGHVGAVAGEDDPRRDSERRRLGPQRGHPVAVAGDEDPGAGPGGKDARGGVEQDVMGLLLAQPADRPDHHRVLRDAQLLAHAPRGGGRRGRELVEGRAVPDERHLLRRHVALADQEVAGGAADRDRAVGERREHAVGQPLVGGHPRIGEVLVQDQRGPAHPRRDPPEIGGGVSVDVQDARAAPADEADEVGGDARVELARGPGGGPGSRRRRAGVTRAPVP